MTLLIDLAAPYPCAGDAELVAVYERFGPMEVLCDHGSEGFFCDYGRSCLERRNR